RTFYFIEMNSASYDLILLLLAFVFPPLGIIFKVGLHNELVICSLLTLLGYFPGVIYAWWIIIRRPGPPYYYIPHSENVNGGNAAVPDVNQDQINQNDSVANEQVVSEPVNIVASTPKRTSEQMASSLPEYESSRVGVSTDPL